MTRKGEVKKPKSKKERPINSAWGEDSYKKHGTFLSICSNSCLYKINVELIKQLMEKERHIIQATRLINQTVRG